MPTENPRVNVTLTSPQYVLLTRLGRMQKCSRSSVLVDLLETVRPVLERVVVALEGAQEVQQEARDGLRGSIERAEVAIVPHLEAALGQLDMLTADFARASPGVPSRTVGARTEGAARVGKGSSKHRKDPRALTGGSGTRRRSGRGKPGALVRRGSTRKKPS